MYYIFFLTAHPPESPICTTYRRKKCLKLLILDLPLHCKALPEQTLEGQKKAMESIKAEPSNQGYLFQRRNEVCDCVMRL